ARCHIPEAASRTAFHRARRRDVLDERILDLCVLVWMVMRTT
ncbi:hypothetical protein HMPREF1985_01593, partial [Mitsuokella sp. oral taxon 131 str. W9106]